MIDKISNRKENLERNKQNPIVQAALSWKNDKFVESTSDERSSDDETPNTTKVVVENVKKTGNFIICNLETLKYLFEQIHMTAVSRYKKRLVESYQFKKPTLVDFYRA